MSDRGVPIPTPTGQAQEALTGIRMMRLSVAMHGVLLALEALASTTLETTLLHLSSWRELASRASARLKACRDLFHDLQSARASQVDAAKLARMREAFDELERVYDEFERANEKAPAARRMEAAVQRIKTESARWTESS